MLAEGGLVEPELARELERHEPVGVGPDRERVGLDVARFTRDLDDPEVEARIAADEKEAARLDVKGTPTAFVNGRRVVGAQPLATWDQAVLRAKTASP